jgi:hypothetical protein
VTHVVVGLAVVVGVAGCGRKGDPLPPQIRRADTTRDLSVFQEGREAVLRWAYPSMTTAGGPLPDLETVEVWRAPIPFGQEPVGTTARERSLRNQLLEAQGERIAVLDDAALDAATQGPNLGYRDDLEAWRRQHGDELHVVLWYAVRTICCGGRASDISNIARLVPQLPPSPPERLTAVPSATGIRLSWLAAANSATLVERSADGENWQQITPAPVSGSEYHDATARQGQRWSYRLRAVTKKEGEGRVVGDPSDSVTVDYPDSYPPPVPEDLVCLPEETRIRLRWQPVAGADAYVIERQVEGMRWRTLAAAHPERRFEDVDPPVGELTYAVRAVDSAGNRSDPVTCKAYIGVTP